MRDSLVLSSRIWQECYTPGGSRSRAWASLSAELQALPRPRPRRPRPRRKLQPTCHLLLAAFRPAVADGRSAPGTESAETSEVHSAQKRETQVLRTCSMCQASAAELAGPSSTAHTTRNLFVAIPLNIITICGRTALTALVGGRLLARADRAMEVGLLQDLGPVDDAIAMPRLVAVVAKAPWAVIARHKTAPPSTRSRHMLPGNPMYGHP